MKKIAVLLAVLLAFVSCGTALAESISVAIVYADTVDDKGWCQSMDLGVKKAIEMGVRDKVKIMIGGAPVNEDFCAKIGADIYTPDAASAADAAVEFCKEA